MGSGQSRQSKQNNKNTRQLSVTPQKTDDVGSQPNTRIKRYLTTRSQRSRQLHKWMLARNKFTIEKKAVKPRICAGWIPFLVDAKPDPYFEITVFKRSSYISMKSDGSVDRLPAAPMRMSKQYNKVTRGKERKYEDVHLDLVNDPAFHKYVQQFSDVHSIEPGEPILVVNIHTRIEPFVAVDADGNGLITREEYEKKTKKTDFDNIDVDGSGAISYEEYRKATEYADPLSGMGIHRDGCQAVSVLCISRENCEGGLSQIFEDHAGKRMRASTTLEPGTALHFCDLDIFHNVTVMQAIDHSKLMHRSVIILAARFQDVWQHETNAEFYGPKGYNCVKGIGDLERLFDLLDTSGKGGVNPDEFFDGMEQICDSKDLIFDDFDTCHDGLITKQEFIACLEKSPIENVNHEKEHFW